MKTAETIHERGREAFAKIEGLTDWPKDQELAVKIQTILMLEEIAAQLAELNERLAQWSWPDGKQGVVTK